MVPVVQSNFYTYITPCSRILLEKPIRVQIIKHFSSSLWPEPCVHRRLSLDHILHQTVAVHILKFHFLNVHFNIILSSMPRCPKLSHSFRISGNCFVFISHISCMLRVHQSYPLWSGKCNNKWELYSLRSSSLWNIFHSHINCSLLGANILFNSVFSDILNLCYSLKVRDNISHPYVTIQFWIFLYLLS
jgi:hypothetical protein